MRETPETVVAVATDDTRRREGKRNTNGVAVRVLREREKERQFDMQQSRDGDRWRKRPTGGK